MFWNGNFCLYTYLRKRDILSELKLSHLSHFWLNFIEIVFIVYILRKAEAV